MVVRLCPTLTAMPWQLTVDSKPVEHLKESECNGNWFRRTRRCLKATTPLGRHAQKYEIKSISTCSYPQINSSACAT